MEKSGSKSVSPPSAGPAALTVGHQCLEQRNVQLVLSVCVCVCVCVCARAHLVVSDSVRPHRPQPTRPLHPWDSPGKNTGVGCHFLLQKELQKESEVSQSCLTLCDPMDCSQPGSSIHGLFQARVLEWVVISFSNLSQYQDIIARKMTWDIKTITRFKI